MTIQYSAWGGTVDPSDPGSVADATVVQQTESSYDAASNLIATTSRQRFAEATGNGPLEDPSTEPEARVYYTANYPDAIGRLVASANYGTNGGAAWTRPDTIPAGSATILVGSFVFDNAGNQVQSIDPMGTVTFSGFDQAGRLAQRIENYIPSAPVAPDVNRTVSFGYNDDGNMVTQTATNPTTGNQVTQWTYGVTTGEGSTINSNALLYQKLYPDSSSPVTYLYNRQGQPISMADQAYTTHEYTYDLFGRLTLDEAVAFGSGVDETVATIQRSYEPRGMLQFTTTYNAASAVLNQVQLVYNNYAQLSNDYQNHSGAGTTLGVGYSYADGSANTIRRTGITYPNGDQITIGYVSAAANALSRPDSILEGSSTLCSYEYLGMSTVSEVTYNAANNLTFTLEDGGTGDAGDVYTGLDRFGRLVETLWKTGSTTEVQSQYGRNRFSGVVWRQDDKAQSLGVTTQDNYYWYDGLYQVQQHERGALTGTYPDYTGISSAVQNEQWGYDAIGNWDSYSSASPANSQTRTQNQANEITGISASVGTVTPTYDAVGQMTTLPVNPGLSASQYTLTWDAWNRLVKVQSGSTTVATYAYDGLTRRITKTNATETRQYYYSDAWRTLEERVNGASVLVDRQYTWGIIDRWDLMRRLRSTGGSSLNEALFVVKDYLDPVAIADDTGSVVERYTYDAFGQTLFMTPGFAALSGSAYDWNFLFHGEFRDDDTTFFNYGYRYYFAQLGRWLSRDPIGSAERTQGPNAFSFIYNDPIGAFDALGMLYCAGVIGRHPKPIDPNIVSWFFGTAPDNTFYGPDAPQTHAMERSNIVNLIDLPRMRDALGKFCNGKSPILFPNVNLNVALGNELPDLHLKYPAYIYWQDLFGNPEAFFIGSWSSGSMTAIWIDCCFNFAFVHFHGINVSGWRSVTHLMPSNGHYTGSLFQDNSWPCGLGHNITETFDWDEIVSF